MTIDNKAGVLVYRGFEHHSPATETRNAPALTSEWRGKRIGLCGLDVLAVGAKPCMPPAMMALQAWVMRSMPEIPQSPPMRPYR